MLKTSAPFQHELEMVTLEQLVPKDHLLRLIDRHIFFDFIRERTQALYCVDNGRPAFDPVLLFRMLLLATCLASDPSAKLFARLKSMSPIAGFSAYD